MDKQLQQKIAAFFQQFPRREFEKGSILIHPAEEVTDVYCIVEGRVVQYDISPTGNEVVVNAFKPSAFFPMSQVVNGTPNHYFFEAASKVRAYQVPAKKAALFVRQNPDVMFHLLQRVFRGTDALLQRTVYLMDGSPRSRLILELLNAAERSGPEANTTLTERDLMKRSGLPHEVVTRVVHDLKEAGLVRMQGRNIVISDIRRLKSSFGAG
jgi:CRP-like cAMP-binding protein